MAIVADLERTLTEFPAATANAEELARLQKFYRQMKDAGIARTREYDLPLPDTVGRSLSRLRRRAG